MQGEDDDQGSETTESETTESEGAAEIQGAEEKPESEDDAGQENEIEARARNMGWVAQDEFRGSADRFIEADVFVGRVEKELPLAIERNRKLNDDLIASNQRIEGLERSSRAQQAMFVKAREQAVEQAKAGMRTAVEEGDTAAFDRAEKAMETATEVPKEETGTQDQQQQPDPQFKPWKDANPWYGKDIEMTIYAHQVGDILRAADELHGKAFYDAATEEMTKKFPDRFGNQRRNAPANVGGGSGQRRGGAKGLRDMPAEDRKALEMQAESYNYTGDEKKEFMAEAAVEYWKEGAA